MNERTIQKRNGKVNGMELSIWLIFTIIYAIFVGFVYFMVDKYIDPTFEYHGIGINVRETCKTLGLASWAIISFFLINKFRKSR